MRVFPTVLVCAGFCLISSAGCKTTQIRTVGKPAATKDVEKNAESNEELMILPSSLEQPASPTYQSMPTLPFEYRNNIPESGSPRAGSSSISNGRPGQC